MDEVECGECSNRYDSDVHAFCPRCGNEGSKPARAADYAPQRFAAGRRRTRAGGIILAVLGAFALAQFAILAIAPPPLDATQLAMYADVELLAGQAGGALHLHVLDNGTAINATVRIEPAQGEAVEGATQQGWFNATAPAAFGNITVIHGNESVHLSYYAPAGQAVIATVDVADAPQWIGAKQLPATRGIAGFLAFFALFVTVAGVLAFRLRKWGIAMSGAVLAVAPALLMAVFIPLAGILLGLPAGLALAFIAGGRRHFT